MSDFDAKALDALIRSAGSAVLSLQRHTGDSIYRSAIKALRAAEEIDREERPEAVHVPVNGRPLATIEVNIAASRGDVIEIGRRRAAITRVEGLPKDAGWAYYGLWVSGSRLGGSTYLTSQLNKALPAIGHWNGDLYEGAAGSVVTPTNQKEADMATKVTRGGKKGSTKPAAKNKPAAKASTNGGSARRSQEDVDALVPKFRKHLQSGGTMRDLKGEYGFSDDGPIRAALYRAGFDSKGNTVEVTPITGSGASRVKKLWAERQKGAAWYELAHRAGMTEAEVKSALKEAGHDITGRVRAPAAPKPASKTAAKPAAKKGAAKPAAKKAAGKKGVTRKATKADPS